MRNHPKVFISLIFLIIEGSLSLSHSASLILSCIFSKVSLSIFANSADISSILFFNYSISFSLFLSFSSCSFLVRAMVSLFFSWLWQNYLVLLLFPVSFCWACRASRYTISASACIGGSWLIYFSWFLHYGEHFLFLSLQIALEVHYPFFDFVFACSVFIGRFLLKH